MIMLCVESPVFEPHGRAGLRACKWLPTPHHGDGGPVLAPGGESVRELSQQVGAKGRGWAAQSCLTWPAR